MGGAGMPCACVRADGLEELDVRLVLENDSQHEINVTPSSQSNTGVSRGTNAELRGLRVHHCLPNSSMV